VTAPPPRRIPVMPVLLLLGSAALVLAMLAPLGSAALSAAGRLLFWATLIFATAWQGRLWFRRVPPLLPASRAALPILFVGGVVLLAVLLPLEYGALAHVAGFVPRLPVPLGWLVAGTALVALAVTIVIITVRWLAVRLDPPARRPGQVL